MSGKIRVVLVDDDPLVRSALALMLGGEADIEVVGDAADGESAIALIRNERPDVALMDIRMPKLDGLETTRRLHAGVAPPPHVIVLTTFDADDHVLAALAAGADGFLLKDTPPADIVAAVRSVVDGDPTLSPSAIRAVIEQVRTDGSDRREDARTRLEALTDRELEVARAVGRGLSNGEIAAELHMSVPTVKAHVSRIFDKLATTNRVQVAICVHDAG